jgi:hypothetical protein
MFPELDPNSLVSRAANIKVTVTLSELPAKADSRPSRISLKMKFPFSVFPVLLFNMDSSLHMPVAHMLELSCDDASMGTKHAISAMNAYRATVHLQG